MVGVRLSATITGSVARPTGSAVVSTKLTTAGTAALLRSGRTRDGGLSSEAVCAPAFGDAGSGMVGRADAPAPLASRFFSAVSMRAMEVGQVFNLTYIRLDQLPAIRR